MERYSAYNLIPYNWVENYHGTQYPVQVAALFAMTAHAAAGNSYDNQPYELHLKQVVKLIGDYACDIDPLNDYTWPDLGTGMSTLTKRTRLVQAGWLHDVIEDTGIKYNDVNLIFGKDVADWVWNVTDERGVNREDRFRKTLPKIRSCEESRYIKLCDRIANVEYSIEHPGPLLDMYMKGLPKFIEVMFPNHMLPMERLRKRLKSLL